MVEWKTKYNVKHCDVKHKDKGRSPFVCSCYSQGWDDALQREKHCDTCQEVDCEVRE